MGTAQLSERILEIFDDFTRSERMLAEHFLENPQSISLNTAQEISKQAGVSKATTARFFSRLGFPSFKTAQRMARDQDGNREHNKRVFSKSVESSGRGILANHLASDVQNLIRTFETVRSDDLETAARSLARADKLWVIGFGDNYPLAHFARAQLIKIKPDIRMIPLGGFSVPEEFASITASDSVLALSIGKRSRTIFSILQSARLAGGHIVCLTDQVASRTADLANVTIRCRTQGRSYFDSLAAPVSLITYLCMAVGEMIGDNALERLHYIEDIHSDWGESL